MNRHFIIPKKILFVVNVDFLNGKQIKVILVNSFDRELRYKG